MQQVSIKELRDSLADIIDQVAIGGKRFEITKFGKRRAVLSPVKKKKRVDFSKLSARGLWKDREDMKDPAQWVRELRESESNRHAKKINDKDEIDQEIRRRTKVVQRIMELRKKMKPLGNISFRELIEHGRYR